MEYLFQFVTLFFLAIIVMGGGIVIYDMVCMCQERKKNEKKQ